MTSDQKLELIRKVIRDVPDFPKPGILFRDITPLLSSPEAMRAALDLLQEPFQGEKVDRIVGMESRGFIFGAPLADRMGVGFAPIRKPGKLPCPVECVTYDLEYGSDSLELHVDAIEDGHRVLIVDDLLATGGTARAAADLVRRLGGQVVGCSFVVELGFLEGRKKLPGETIRSLITY